MRQALKYICLPVLLTLGGCIENDIPYAIVVADITAFEVEGQLADAAIDKTKRQVTVELDETVDPKNVHVLKFEVNNDAAISPEISEHINLSTPLEYTLTTYQDYRWKITGVQNIERYVRAGNQVGDATFHIDQEKGDYQAILRVSATQPLDNINISSMKLGPRGSVISPDYKTIKDYSGVVIFTVTWRDIVETWKVVAMHLDP